MMKYQKSLPSICILIPTYNEEKIIYYKLNNILSLDYPKNMLNIIFIDSASTDNTAKIIEKFILKHSKLNVKIIKEKIRKGKSIALNNALQIVKSDIVVVSDADCFLPSDILMKTVPYFSDMRIGAIAAEEKILNDNKSWIIKSEKLYRDKMLTIRVGASKLHSTIRFEGGFGAYKRSVLNEFDCITGADDSGTALNIVQRGLRTIIVPDINFFTFFPQTWVEKFNIKYRRANHLIRLYVKSLKLFIKGQLILPKKIALPEIYLHIFNPMIFLIFLYCTIIMVLNYPFILIFFVIIMIPSITRSYVVEIIQNNIILILALFGIIINRKFIMWHKSDGSRNIASSFLLKEKDLIQSINMYDKTLLRVKI